MKEFPVTLIRNVDRSVIQAALRLELTAMDLVDAEEQWAPFRIQAYRRCHEKGLPLPENNHWDWMSKADKIESEAAIAIGIQEQSHWEGLLLITNGKVRSLVSHGEKLLYVDYLQTAPWNDGKYTTEPRHRGVGSRLIQAAVEYSMSSGCNGRIGLHSLPEAESFYRDKFGMEDFGPDLDYDKLVYFELTSEQSYKFLGKQEKQ